MKNCLVVIDMQNDFISGSLGTDEAKKIVPNVKSFIEEAIKNGDDIYFTKDTHYENYLNTMEGKKLPVKHCIKGTWGHDICDELKPFEKNAKNIFIKETATPSVSLRTILPEKPSHTSTSQAPAGTSLGSILPTKFKLEFLSF